MALVDSEVYLIRWHLGYNVLTIFSEPYIAHAAIFEQVIKPYIESGSTTTSSTTVTAQTSYTPVTLTLGSASGFTAGCRIVVDVDSRQEIATVQAVSGSTITVLLTKAHSGTYPVTVEGGETLIRDILGKLKVITDKIQAAASTAGLKRVEDIEWYQSTNSTATSQFAILRDQLEFWRDELASALGLGRWGAGSGGAPKNVELY